MNNIKQIGFLLIFVVGFFIQTLDVKGQKVLNELETAWVEEAKSELGKALSDPGMSESNRLAIIERSAKTLKEYGQPYAYPDGEIPLKKMMDDNFEQCRKQVAELSDWSLNLSNKSFDQKMKLINTIQIEVIEEQIELLIPGNTPVQLSKDVINSVFGLNFAEGVNGGKSGDAQSLAERFKQLAKANQFRKNINVVIFHEKESLRNIDKDRNYLKILEAKMKQKYKYAESSTRTMSGYEGAQLGKSSNSNSIPVTTQNSKPKIQSKNSILVGTWKFGFPQTGYFYWTFKNDGTFSFDDKMNEGSEVMTGKYSVSGNTLTLYGPKHECGDTKGVYPFKMDYDEFQFGKISDGCMSRQLTLNHIWRK